MLSFREYLAVIRRRWRLVAWCVTLVMSAAVIVAFGSEAIYRSTGTIMIEAPNISPELARTTVASVSEQQLRLVSRRVMRSDNIDQLVEEYNLFPELSGNERARELRASSGLEQVDPVTFEPRIGASAFSVSFDYPDPFVARDVTAALLDLYIADNRAVRTESAADTEAFFREEAARLEAELTTAGDELADFKLRNQGLLPEDIDTNKQLLERLTEDRYAVESNVRVAAERRNLLAVQYDELAGGTQLAQLEAELAVARQKYSENHPDIRRLTRAIDALKSANGDSDIDPEVSRVAAQLDAVEAEIAAYETRERDLRRRIDDLQGRLVSAPEVEKELLRLTSQYAIASTEYEAVRQKQSEARMGSNLESQDKSIRYTVIRNPGAPLIPVFPNRFGILAIGFLIAVGGSAALVALREGGDVSVRGTRDVMEVFGSPPIANVPLLQNGEDRQGARRRLMAHCLGCAAVWAVTVGILVNG